MPSTRPEPTLSDVLSRAERRVNGRLAAVLAASGSSLDEWRVLALLAGAGGQSMSEISTAVLLAPPTLTKRIDAMVADGLVHRRVDQRDRRRVLVLLAPRGRDAHLRLSRHVADELDRLTGVAERAGLDLTGLAGLLGELVHALDEPPDGLDPVALAEDDPGRELEASR